MEMPDKVHTPPAFSKALNTGWTGSAVDREKFVKILENARHLPHYHTQQATAKSNAPDAILPAQHVERDADIDIPAILKRYEVDQRSIGALIDREVSEIVARENNLRRVSINELAQDTDLAAFADQRRLALQTMTPTDGKAHDAQTKDDLSTLDALARNLVVVDKRIQQAAINAVPSAENLANAFKSWNLNHTEQLPHGGFSIAESEAPKNGWQKPI